MANITKDLCDLYRLATDKADRERDRELGKITKREPAPVLTAEERKARQEAQDAEYKAQFSALNEFLSDKPALVHVRVSLVYNNRLKRNMESMPIDSEETQQLLDSIARRNGWGCEWLTWSVVFDNPRHCLPNNHDKARKSAVIVKRLGTGGPRYVRLYNANLFTFRGVIQDAE